ncbi:MAG TPA: Rieske 2Fe-2S domain-containing protein [Ramlibacter sp.]|nr:Rieske 2Fe-2S domain-containing protein [Ramlibacter sp.]
MLTQEQNEKLTRVGPGTPMGELMRRYWHPVAAKAQLLERGVMPVRIFGEDLVLFLDGQGRMGLVSDRCAHRLVKLDTAYTTDQGIRCPYHGWTYDVQGQCVDQPGEPAGSRFKDNVHLRSYPVQELAGLVFAYLGPLPAPLLPRWDRLVWDNVFRVICFIKIPCNWLQCMENTPDPTHATFLHGQFFKDWLRRNDIADERVHRLAEGFSTPVIKHDYTVGKYGIDRRWLLEGQTGDNDVWSESLPLVFPDIHCTSGNGRHTFGWRLPIDDYNTMEVVIRAFEPGPGVEVPKQDPVPYCEIPMVDENGNYCALQSVTGQDVMVWVAQGPIMDRTKELLGSTDRGIVLYRRLLLEQMEKVQAGQDPINVFRDPAENQCLSLPVPGDRGNAWGIARDGSYVRGSATAADMIPQHLKDEIEDLYVRAASARRRPEESTALERVAAPSDTDN